MKRKIIATILIVIPLAVLLFFAASALVLFLAPGTELFGIRYVASGISRFDSREEGVGSFNIEEYMGDKIIVKTKNVPITINFSEYFTTEAYFHQDFVGFTRSKLKKAGLLISHDEDNNLVIEAQEIEKWLYAHEANDAFKFELTLPMSFSKKQLIVNSSNSSVGVNGAPSFGYEHFEVKTSGALTLEKTIKADNFVYHTTKNIVIDDKIECINADLKTKSNIDVKKALIGNLKVETTGGDVKFVACKSLTAVTGSGSIKPYGSGHNVVRGSVGITTRGGNVDLGNVALEDEKATVNIKTVSGSITISSTTVATLSSERGKISVGSAKELTINNHIGGVDVGSVTEKITVDARNGRVDLGTNGVVNNPTVKAVTGQVNVKGSGNIDLHSTSNSVSLTNVGGTQIRLHAGKGLNATDLEGEVNIYADGDCNISFKNISGNVNISTGNKSDKVNIDATCVNYQRVNYFLKSSKGTKANLYALDELLESNTTIENIVNEIYFKINVSTTYAQINLKLGA